MANPTTRQGLIDYCLRRLGEPVIEINVDPDQLEDRVDEGIQYWQEFHSEATYRTYVSHLVGDSDVSNEYVDVSDDVLFVSKLFRISSSFNTSFNFFDIKYQMMLNDIADMQNFAGDLAYYDQLNQYLSLLDMKLNGEPQTTYSRKMNRLYLHGDFNDKDVQAGDYIVYEAFKTVDPTAFGKVYNDMWLKEYTTELIKQQWGANLSKFEGMQMPGGVTLNGRQLYDDATTQIERLREKIRSDFEMPADFFVG
jgi:hypothetical protein